MIVKIVIGIIAVVFFAYVGYKYVKVGSSKYSTKKDWTIGARRLYVKENNDIFGVCNNGTSLDQREIYVLTLEELGL